MSLLSLKNNQLKIKTSGDLPFISEESVGYTSNQALQIVRHVLILVHVGMESHNDGLGPDIVFNLQLVYIPFGHHKI